MPKRILVRALRSLNAPAARYPADPRVVFILALCVLSGIPLAMGNATPGSINDQLDTAWVVIWGVMLVVGALTTLIGVLKLDADGILLEQIGSVAVGGASLLYAGAIFAKVQWAGSVPMLIIAGFGIACFWRWGQLQSLIRHARRIADEGGER
jgi:cytochrome bd-type quinol oxidase subunit 2